LSADLPELYAGFALIRDLRDRGEVDHVIAGHQPGILERFPSAAEGPAGLVSVIGRRAA
jgi:hypothetical protein